MNSTASEYNNKKWSEFTIHTSDSLKLYGATLGNSVESEAVVVLVHGLGEHFKRYQHVAEKMTDQGLYVVGFDQRGHGRSEGKKGHAPSSQQLMRDISVVIGLAKSNAPHLPVFLYGHSLGALEVLYYALTEKPELKGVIATSPPLDISSTPQSKITMAKVMNPILPGLIVSNALDTTALSRDPEIVEAYKADPLVHDKISVRLGAFLIEGAQYVLEHAAEWTLPLYLAHGTQDRICKIAGTDAFYERANGPITYKRWEGLYHETHNEPEKEQVIQTMLDWIGSQL